MTEITKEERYWLWLSSVDGIGPVRFYDTLNVFTDLEQAFHECALIPELVKSVTAKQKKALLESANESYIDRLLDSCTRKGIQVLTRLNQDYPHTLAEIENPPPVLFYKGVLPNFDEMSCAIVGSRRPTKNGFSTARSLACGLAGEGVVIVSGMARGIDTAAHMGALEANGITVAVLGCGADVVYPQENRELYERILDSGAVISEFLPGTEPKPQFFPQRNRIVSGLSNVLIAGEGGERSGARITVDDALRQGRDVYTMICDLKSPVAKLPLYLMDSGAPVVQKAADVMNGMGWRMRHDSAVQKSKNGANKLDLLEAQIYNLLLKENLSAGDLAGETGIAIKDINTILTVMELKGLIEGMPGDRFRINS
ncbi:DNA-processing protein DprA [Christensenella tenuis]|uniref:DNA-protecting protein DprA n=1 Tax=Christensenella tenuis TaxID=2763033 RepID=A0ABR7EBH2_9FIRM|nr:DNA-processing protein DprA [Christensenella tenuis]MBC5647126.1 DNA-protecting protein DprA [Christensenella tenuis]